nr:methionyl-tRNA formyltransferase [Hansschlegelia beijingensis]
MALIRSFEETAKERVSLHEEISAKYCVIERDGRTLVQIDTYGRTSREMPGKISQSFQLDRTGAERLVKILKAAFDL